MEIWSFLTSNAHLENHQRAGNVNHLLHCVTTYQVKKYHVISEKKNCAIEAIWETSATTDRRCCCPACEDLDRLSMQCTYSGGKNKPDTLIS